MYINKADRKARELALAVRQDTIKEFAEKLRSNIGSCRIVMNDDTWEQGVNTADLLNLIKSLVTDMQTKPYRFKKSVLDFSTSKDGEASG